MLIDQMELSVDAMDLPLEEIGQHNKQATVSHQRPIYARGRMGNISGQLSGDIGIKVPVRRGSSFKFNIWTNVAEEQDQAVTLLQSTVQQLTADNAEQQMTAIKVLQLNPMCNKIYKTPCMHIYDLSIFTFSYITMALALITVGGSSVSSDEPR